MSFVDSKGRVLVPLSIREAAGIKPQEKVLVAFDSARRSIVIEPAHEKKTLHLEVLLADRPGSLAQAAYALSELGVDLIYTQSRSFSRGEAAIWSVECNPGKNSIGKIKEALEKAGSKVKSAKWR
jgi:bifunctional DNA-binding transcriptional regulator/antitoxin component of YhaV-PrlF toxin-antitoxin module